MDRVVRNLRWYDLAVVLIGLAVVFALQPAAPSVLLYPEKAALTVAHGASFDGPAAAAYARDFSRGGYFGAFAVGDDGAFGWTIGSGSIRAARANALAHCRQRGAGCAIVADLTPEGFRTDEGVTLRYNAAQHYLLYRHQNGARAFAASENGATGSGFGYSNVWAARARALRECRDRVRQNQPAYLPDWPCRIVHSAWF